MHALTPVARFPATGFGTTAANIAATTVIEVTVAAPSPGVPSVAAPKKVRLLRCKVKHLAGAAANFTPLIFSASGITTANDIEQEFAGTLTATGAGNLHDPQVPENTVFWTDANGKFYFLPGPNAGANNQFEYELRYEILG